MTPKGFLKPVKQVEADKTKVLWCPFCEWHMHDVYVNRRRLGIHMVNAHYEDVAYPEGVEPDPID